MKKTRRQNLMLRSPPSRNFATSAKEPRSGIKSQTQDIGHRIRFMRQQRGMTLDTLSEHSGLTKSFISKIERGMSVPSISTAMRIAASFNMTVGQLLGEEEYDDAICVVRKGERRRFMRSGSTSGYNYEMIAGGKRFKTMEPYIMRPPKQFQDDRMFEHVGEEIMFVLSGSVDVQFASRLIRLKKGDAVYFDSQVPHRSRSAGATQAEVLVVITAGT